MSPIALVLGAALADHFGAHSLAFDALLLAVPVTAIAGLRSVADRLDGKAEPTHAFAWALVLAFLLVATAARAPSVGGPAVPAGARAAVIAGVRRFVRQAPAAPAGGARTG